MAPVSCMFQRLFLHDNSFTTKLKMVASNKEPGFQDMEKKRARTYKLIGTPFYILFL